MFRIFLGGRISSYASEIFWCLHNLDDFRVVVVKRIRLGVIGCVLHLLRSDYV